MSYHYTCTDCHRPIPTGGAVLRGNGHELNAWHPACFTVHRAVSGIDAPAIAAEVGPLTRRLVEAGVL